MDITYNWTKFEKNELADNYYTQVNDFFCKLIEMGKASNDRIFVFISVEAVCLVLLWKKEGKLQEWNFPTYSDLYIMKNTDENFLEGKSIVLVDESITTGEHLIQIYNLILEKTNVSSENIYPVVFAADKDFWPQKKSLSKVFEKLEYMELFSCNQILKFTSIENLLFYQEGIPYAVEFPVLKKRNNSTTTDVIVDEDQFNQICKGDSMWKYFACPQIGYKQNDTSNGVLVLSNHIFNILLSEFLQAMTVRIQIVPILNESRQEQMYRLIFIPFVILKSARFSQLFSFFKSLYQNTDYVEKVVKLEEKESKEHFPQKTYILVYRYIVYMLNTYVGEELKKFIKSTCNIELAFDYNCQIKNFDEGLYSFLSADWERKRKQSLLMTIISEGAFDNVPPRPSFENSYMNYPTREYTYKRAYNFVLELINDVRHKKFYTGIQYESKNLITMEELEHIFKKTFYGIDEEDLKVCLIQCISSMLNQGCLKNELYYDKDHDIVYHGFCFGQNSDAFYDVSAKIFCAAILKYYNIVGQKYLEKYDFFEMYLLRFFKKENLIDSLISMDEFYFYSRYFRIAAEKGFSYQILNKEFLFEDNIPYYISTVQNYLEELDFYD